MCLFSSVARLSGGWRRHAGRRCDRRHSDTTGSSGEQHTEPEKKEDTVFSLVGGLSRAKISCGLTSVLENSACCGVLCAMQASGSGDQQQDVDRAGRPGGAGCSSTRQPAAPLSLGRKRQQQQQRQFDGLRPVGVVQPSVISNLMYSKDILEPIRVDPLGCCKMLLIRSKLPRCSFPRSLQRCVASRAMSEPHIDGCAMIYTRACRIGCNTAAHCVRRGEQQNPLPEALLPAAPSTRH